MSSSATPFIPATRERPNWDYHDGEGLTESFRKKGKTRGGGGVALPLDPTNHEVKNSSMVESFPFDKVELGKVKIKEIPIKLCWPVNGGKNRKSKEGGEFGGKVSNEKKTEVDVVQVD